MTEFFASDNAAPAHPSVIEAIVQANEGHAISYGDDEWTRRAEAQLADLFDREVAVLFVYNGTGANVVALRAMTASWQAVVCTHMAHINQDECGAPEAAGGFKLLTVTGTEGRLAPTDIEPLFAHHRTEHSNLPTTVSITQATELGTIYHRDDLTELATYCRGRGLKLHMDGARIANAAASYHRSARASGRGIGASEAMQQAVTGVDSLSFGATKNGIAFGEAVVVFGPMTDALRYLRKQSSQLHSKMRYIAAQFIAYLTDDLWLENALHANGLAQRLADGLVARGLQPAYPVEANGVFVALPPAIAAALTQEFHFYQWEPETGVVRLMLSHTSSAETIERFLSRYDQLAAAGAVDAG